MRKYWVKICLLLLALTSGCSEAGALSVKGTEKSPSHSDVRTDVRLSGEDLGKDASLSGDLGSNHLDADMSTSDVPPDIDATPDMETRPKLKPWDHGKLKVSADHHMLEHTDGTEFFWMGDTAWHLFWRLDREKAGQYLEDRKTKGYTLIQASVYPSKYTENAYGEAPFSNNDFNKPNEAYWEHVDYIISKAEELGLYIGVLPTWNGVIGNQGEAATFASWLAKRYKNRVNIVWINGGDSNPDSGTSRAIWDEIGTSIRAQVGENHLITYHPSGGASSSQWFHNASWLDFNMIQSGHSRNTKDANIMVRSDYNRSPTKPVIDGEPRYETIEEGFYKPNPGPRITPAEVREIAYTQLFSGTFGHTYGHHSIWMFYEGGEPYCCGDPTTTWQEALNAEGGRQMQYVSKLMQSRPVLGRVPDTLVLAGNGISTRGEGYVFVYLPEGGNVKIQLGKTSGTQLKGWWYNPREGVASSIGEFSNQGQEDFNAPDSEDWVLVLDDVAKGYKKPGEP